MNQAQSRSQAFTLVELMAVVLVICMLAAIGLSTAGYVQTRIAISSARGQMALLESALESYKSDWGYYPATEPARISNSGAREGLNNWYLYRALSGANGGKRYATFLPGMARANTAVSPMTTGSTVQTFMNIYDPWGTPYNYYNSPATTFGVTNDIPTTWPAYAWPWTNSYWYGGCAYGGQVNGRSYDLLSYGPDRVTYVRGARPLGGGYNRAWYGGTGASGDRWTNAVSALDDLANFSR